jgi:hypothetical protein
MWLCNLQVNSSVSLLTTPQASRVTTGQEDMSFLPAMNEEIAVTIRFADLR